MPRYFFDVHDGIDIIDEDGTELPNIDVAKEEAVKLAGRLLQDDAKRFWTGDEWTIRVHDENGLTLLELTFFANLAPALSKGTARA